MLDDSDIDRASGDDSGDSDRELQVAFSRGLLKPGLNYEAPEQKTLINNAVGLQQSLQDLKNDLPWLERMDLTVDPTAAPKPMLDQLGPTPDELTGDDVHDDFKREMIFYRQAQAAVLEGIPRLHKLGIKTRRPEDYFAEMTKSDAHMKKVREKLMAKHASMERSEKAKKMRELRKYGKKVQIEVLQKRQKEKKQMLDQVKKFRKGKQDRLDFLEDGPRGKGKGQHQGGTEKRVNEPGKKRNVKNKKFGFGGQKKRSKQNTADSSADMGGFRKSKHGAKPGAKPGAERALGGSKANRGGNKNKRPGKRRRQNTKGGK